eukprot:TRINITY_DN97523_c0_g1_i1.p1 TRINITY_DN97523_c0_g1~~TRINITY_DN97523_c0_g1_i1.p1  ORF type:complete len:248 (+),score=66.56 TRINITY_DN97523_c0_g1_i1:39-746(+)
MQHLQFSLEELQEEVARISSEQGLHKRQVDLLHHAFQQATEQAVSLEERLGLLEHDREAAAKSNRNSFDSLGTRLTELAVEIAQMWTADQVQDSLASLEELLAAAEARCRESLTPLEKSLKDLGQELQLLKQDGEHCRCDLDGARQDIVGLLRLVWVEALPQSPMQSPREPGSKAWPSDGRVPPLLQPLAGRVTHVEQLGKDLQAALDRKADLEEFRIHTHDRLVSKDGSTSFAL